mmetsp:Transcript_14723/g.13332  ORF Transcript_14723/g.13332 Transcript_14723/m.13332 type:complete len:182 (-) Transcript_14723:8-553(-)
MFYIYIIAILCLINISSILSFKSIPINTIISNKNRNSFKLLDVPLELKGKLDPSKKWTVKFIFKGEEKEVEISEGTSFLEIGEKIFDDVESSCRNGVCTTCSGQVIAGRENVQLAVHGLGEPQLEKGFVCTCQAFAIGPGVVVKLGMYEEVYESQYGQYELSYELKDGAKKDIKQNKIFGF